MLIASTDFAVFYWRSLRGSEVANYRTCKEPQNDSGFVRQKEKKRLQQLGNLVFTEKSFKKRLESSSITSITA